MPNAVKGQGKTGGPTADSPSVRVRIPPDQATALDAWIARQPEPKPTRPEAIRQILAQCFRGEGYLDPDAPASKRRHF